MDKKDKKVAEKQITTLQAYKNVFGSREGKIVLQDMMKVHNIKTSSFHVNPNVMAFNEGERNVVLRILTKLNLDIDEIRKRLEEADV